ncbi:putative mitochondrial folate carrier protein Flx1 [Ramicandelaber brevisporus]|nr:putative mitochondrial folate carrier protein Flx1 [Ramicandelaber brevisporus]
MTSTTKAEHSRPKSWTWSPAVDHGLAGIGAGFVSTFTLHPLDFIKTRLQVDDTARGKQKPLIGRSITVVRSAWINEGGLRSLYRGLTPNLAGNVTSWGLYLFWYNGIKQRMAEYNLDNSNSDQLSSVQFLSAAALGGALTQLCANPLWVVKTRMCTTSSGQQGSYRGLWDGLSTIARTEGIRGLYRGLVPGLMGCTHGAFQFMAYEEMRRWRSNQLKRRYSSSSSSSSDAKLSAFDITIMSSTSKVFAALVTYPVQVIRARLQNPKTAVKYSGFFDAVRKMAMSEGPLGFYKGLGPNIARMLPGSIITFNVMEFLSALMARHAT